MKKCPFGDKKSYLSVQQSQSLVLGGFHDGTFAGSLVVDAAQVQHAVNDHTVQRCSSSSYSVPCCSELERTVSSDITMSPLSLSPSV